MGLARRPNRSTPIVAFALMTTSSSGMQISTNSLPCLLNAPSSTLASDPRTALAGECASCLGVDRVVSAGRP